MSDSDQKNQHRTWVRLTSVCNNHCLFCLDSNSQDGTFVPDETIRENIRTGYHPDTEGRLILSGGEASIHPRFFEFIAYGREVGYAHIQTITNGRRFADSDFCRRAFESGLAEVTFSLHGHTPALHDGLVGAVGAFESIERAIAHIRTTFPHIIANIDIVVNRANFRFLPHIVRHGIHMGVREFDILQIIPFGRAYSEYRDRLFYDLDDAMPYLRATWRIAELAGIRLWTNRFPSEALEGYESLLQNPAKIRDEVLGDGHAYFDDMIRTRTLPGCAGDRCGYCFLYGYCHDYADAVSPNLSVDRPRISIQAVNDLVSSVERYVVLRGNADISVLRGIFGATSAAFLDSIRSRPFDDTDELVNVPLCIRTDHNAGRYENILDVEPHPTRETYTEHFIDHLERAKSLRCRTCVHTGSCPGIGRNFIRTYGFGILRPIVFIPLQKDFTLEDK